MIQNKKHCDEAGRHPASFFSGHLIPIAARSSVYALLCVFLIITSCADEEEPEKTVIVTSTRILSRTAGELRSFLGASSFDIDLNTLKYDVDIDKVTYMTRYKNSEITASGLVVLPKTSDHVGMISFQHGTILAQAEAPSALALNNTQLILFSALGSTGFIGAVPDFIGFGESKHIFHPYYVEEPTAVAVIDNLKAARELARKNSVQFNEKLFLAGYSQGGYATMAAHKYIETEGLKGFNLVASFPASGGYDIKGMQEYFFRQQTYNQPHYLAYVALSYQSYYGWTGVLNDFFREPYASRIPSLFNGVNTAGIINDQLTYTIPDLVQENLLKNVDTDAKYKYIVDAFNENSLLDWTPSVKMYMYHGNADTTVPYQNSVDTYNHFISAGASPETVTLTALPGADHGSGIIPYIEELVKVVLVLK
jgi:pimeloyl-ACP methyl ester carboxylesterase